MRRPDRRRILSPAPRARALAAPDGPAPGRQREFEVVALVHRETLYRTAVRLCRNPTEAEDLVQETYLRAFRRFNRFAPGTNCQAWLRTILRNVFLNRVVRAGREVPEGDGCTLERQRGRGVLAAKVITPQEELLRGLVDDRLVRALDGLPPSLREVVLLASFGEHSYREIAEMCELPIGTVMSRLFRARRRLRRVLRGSAPRHAGSLGALNGLARAPRRQSGPATRRWAMAASG